MIRRTMKTVITKPPLQADAANETGHTPSSPAAAGLLSKIESNDAVIGIIGLGYVGLPLARAVHDAGFRVLGYDVDDEKIDMLRKGGTYLQHLGTEMTAALSQSDRFDATNDEARLAEVDVIIICVPTPLGEHQDPDLSYVLSSTALAAKLLRKGQLIVLESTTYPGTTREKMLPILEQTGLTCGEDFFLAYSPEREDPGRKDHSTQTIPKLVGGIDEISGDLAMALYSRSIASVHRVRSAEIAEAAKLLENIFRAVNIALVNELKVLLTDMDIDVWEVIAAAATKPFGFMPFYPGPGLGGHCIPIDPFYLTWKAREIGHHTKFIELAGEINCQMPEYVVARLMRALNEFGKAMKGADVLIIGVAYKPNIDDMRESPAAEIIELLASAGAHVAYHDPHVPRFPPMRKYDIKLESSALTPERLDQTDCVLIVTNHDSIDYALIAEHAQLVVDTRNAMTGIDTAKAVIVKA